MSKQAQLWAGLWVMAAFLLFSTGCFFNWDLTFHSAFRSQSAFSELRGKPVINPPIIGEHTQHLVSPILDGFFWVKEHIGIAYSDQVLYLTFLQSFLFSLCLFLIAFRISKSVSISALILGIFAVGNFSRAGLGYFLSPFGPAYEGTIGMALGLLGLALWFYEKRLWATVVAAFIAYVHPVHSVTIFGFILLSDLMEMFQRRRAALPCALRLLVFFVVISPVLSLIWREIQSVKGLELNWEYFWRLMDVRKPFHVRSWIPEGTSFPFFLASATGILSLSSLQSREVVDQSTLDKCWTLFLGSAVTCLIAIVGTDLFKSSTIAAATLTRTSVFVLPILPAIFLTSLVGRSEIYRWSLASLFALFLLSFSGSSNSAQLGFFAVMGVYWTSPDKRRKLPIWAWLWAGLWVSYFLILIFVSHFSVKAIGGFGVCLFCVGRVIGIGESYWHHVRKMIPSVKAANVTIPLVVVFSAAFVWNFSPILGKIVRPDPQEMSRRLSIKAVREWLAANSKPDELLLTDPNIGCAPNCLGRHVVFNTMLMGMSYYTKSTLPQEQEVLKLLFGVDLMNSSDYAKMKADLAGELGKRYRGIDTRKLNEILDRYPSVALKLDRRDEEMPQLGFPVVFENEGYRIIRLRNFEVGRR